MDIPDLIRYGTWGGIVATAEANRRHYRMTTTWLPHLVANTVALLLPDLHRLLARPGAASRGRGSIDSPAGLARLGADTLAAVVRDNPAYVAYVLPLAAGYLLSNPHFTIYKGRAAELRLGGFGLDALPHAATAFALTALVGDTLRAAAGLCDGGRAGLLLAARRHEAAVTALALALATLLWEVGEYRIHQHELARRGSPEAINMQWSPEDTLYDCLSNLLGWAAATLWRQRRGGSRQRGHRPAPLAQR
jgi:hypothetical protein